MHRKTLRLSLITLLFSHAITIFSKENRLKEIIQESVSQGYHEEFIGLVELIYGSNFLSQGGEEAVEKMLRGMSLKPGASVLDIGSGLGGPSWHLASKYPVKVVGLEPQLFLLKGAQESFQNKKGLKGSLDFVHMTDPGSLRQFEDNSFDLVFSKETILHIPIENKQFFFSEIYRVLKPKGKIVFSDWLRNTGKYSEQTLKMMELDEVAYHLIKESEYKSFLSSAGFSEISFETIKEDTLAYCERNIARIKEVSEQIKCDYDQETYDYSLTSWTYQRDAFKNEEIAPSLIHAQKD